MISCTTASPITSTPAGFMLESGAQALGCTVFPGGTGQTELQVQAMADLAPAGYVGTPSFLRIILEKADELGVKLPSLRKALVSGEAFLAPHREALVARDIQGYQVYATADLGSIAYETRARAGLVVDEGVLVEIVRPGHRRSGPRRRSRRSRGHRAHQRRLSADPFRHRRSVCGAAWRLAVRAHEPAHQGVDGSRRPDDEGQGHVRASGRRSRRSLRAIPRSRRRGWSSRTRTATTA